MNKIAALFALAMLPAIGSAEMLGEYFWDTDPGFGNGRKLRVFDVEGAIETHTLDASGLAPGVHMLGFRVYSHRLWSPTVYNFVACPPDDKDNWKAEYFWDTDPGIGCASPLGGICADEICQLSVPTEGLLPGYHNLGIRSYSGGVWSAAVINSVYIEPVSTADAYEFEYFWDTDPGIGCASPLGGVYADEICQLSVPTEGLLPGYHNLGIRSYSGGVWSTAVINSVYIEPTSPGNVYEIEYFWGEDPGIGNATRIPVEKSRPAMFAANSSGTTSLEFPDLPFPTKYAEEYVLGVRAHTEYGWSPTATASIPHVYAYSVEIEPSHLSIAQGDSARLSLGVKPDDAFATEVEWVSSNPEVVSVSEDGTIMALNAGTATVTASLLDGTNLSAHSLIQVNEVVAINEVAGGFSIVEGPGSIEVVGAASGTILRVTTAAGIVIHNSTEMKVTGLAPGVYVISVNGLNRKVIIR